MGKPIKQEKAIEGNDEFDDLIPAWFEITKVIIAQKEDFSELNRGEGAVLLLLSKCPQGLSAGELSETLHLTTGRMANILHQLEKKDYIERETLLDNRRKTKITLTDAGTEHTEIIFANAKEHASDILHRLGRKDTEELIRIFKKLTSNESEQRAQLNTKSRPIDKNEEHSEGTY